MDDPAFDLAVVAAVLSSDQDIPLGEKTCFAAEVGLSGEIRPVTRIEQRIGEAQRLGFDIVFVSAYNQVRPAAWPAIRVIPIERIEQLIKFCVEHMASADWPAEQVRAHMEAVVPELRHWQR